MEQPGLRPESPSTKPSVLDAKLNKVLNVSSKDHIRRKAALTSLSAIPDISEADLQHNLRGAIQKKEIEKNKKFVEAFGKVVQHLEKLEININAMDDICNGMKNKLDNAHTQATKMLEQIDVYKEESSVYSTRILLVDGFLDKFMLSEDDARVLSASREPIDDTFFAALDRLMQIQRDCRVLLSTEHQKAGTQIMESMAQHQEVAYEKLFRWMQDEAPYAFGGESLDVSGLMSKALMALRYRPVSFQTVLDELVTIRRNAVSHAFTNAMTKGGPGGTPRPIDLQSHDPLRYIGDMLAWIHQACASESEMLENLFHPASEKSPSGNTNDDNDTSSLPNTLTTDAIQNLLGSAMEGVCRPLKARMDQALLQTQDATKSYRAANLIQYYVLTVGNLLPKNASLSKIIYETAETAYKHFYSILSQQAQHLLKSAEAPLTGSEVMDIVRNQVKQLKDILASYENSLIVATGAENDISQFNFGETLDEIVDPLLEMCNISCRHLGPITCDIYLVNCMRQIESAMIPYQSTKQKQVLIKARLDDLVTTLVSEQYKELLSQSHLEKIVDALNDKDPETPLSKDHTAETLVELLSALGPFLRASEEVLPQLNELSTVKDRDQIRSEAFKRLIGTYQRIHEAISDPANGYENPELILPFTLEGMETITAIFIQDM